MSHKSAIELMQESVWLKNEVKIVRLITNELLNSYLLHGLEKNKLSYDMDYYNFDLHAIILETIGFTEEEIKSEVEDWYFKKQREIMSDPQAMNKSNIGTTALHLYFDIKEYRKQTLKKMVS